MTNDKALNIKLPADMYNKVKEEAERKHISLGSMTRIILSEYFDKKSQEEKK